MERVAQAWDRMGMRERVLVSSLLLVCVPIALFFFVALPVTSAKAKAELQLDEAVSLQNWVSERHSEWSNTATHQLSAAGANTPVGITGIETALEDSGLRPSVTTLENSQDGRIRLQLDGASFADFARFLESAGPELGYNIASLRITPGDIQGSIAARLDLQP